ncbi:hypothetical protein KA050_03730 [Candidatus Gracilibacteria bacterium]|nr:hypothetical protein [Candidatus Gracilibacteria bacterium]
MTESPDASGHPLLEGEYIGFVRVECDGEVEKNTPYLIRYIGGQVERVFSAEEDIQYICIDVVQERFRQCLRGLKIHAIVTPFLMPSEGFLGVQRFINFDEALGMGSCNPESPHYNGNETVHWESYEPLQTIESTDCDNLLEDMGVQVKVYDIEEREFIVEEDM